jgi:hypothetical protein
LLDERAAAGKDAGVLRWMAGVQNSKISEGRCAADETVVTSRVLTGGRPDSTPATNSIWCQGDENDSLMTVLLLEIVSLRLWFRRCCSKVHGRQRENTKAGIQDRTAV